MAAALQIGSAPAALLAPVDALTLGFVLPDITTPAQPTSQAAASHELRQGFQVGHYALMIRFDAGSSLTDLPATRRLPNSPAWFLGMANLNGVLIPVFDLAHYLGAGSQAPADQPMLLVLGHGDDAAGIVIDGLPQRLRVSTGGHAGEPPDNQLLDAPTPPELDGCVGATCWAAGRLWMDLRVDALLQRLNEELAAGADHPIPSLES